jgi:cytochrome P450
MSLRQPGSWIVQWGLIELCRRPELQKRLRDELRAAYPASDPSYDELSSSQGLPMLDAVVHETLRLHPAITETVRVVCPAARRMSQR